MKSPFHILQPIGSSFILSLDDFLESIKTLNNAFSVTNMEFFLCELPKYIQGEETHYRQTSYKLGQAYNKSGKINVYVVEKLIDSENDNTYCGLGSLPSAFNIGTRRIVLVKECFHASSVFIHEMGHFLGLYHTHNEWADSELVDGSNCEIAGDYICDTPADPNLLYLRYRTSTSACIYTDSLRDLNDELFLPDVTNYMSYSVDKCRNTFSPQQIQIMNYHAANSFNFLSNCPKPNFAYSYIAPSIVTSEGFNLYLKNGKINMPLKISIWSLIGQQMRVVESYKQQEEKLLFVDVANLPIGFYTLSIEYEQLNKFEEIETFKFYKSR